jgi:hypothetical protein
VTELLVESIHFIIKFRVKPQSRRINKLMVGWNLPSYDGVNRRSPRVPIAREGAEFWKKNADDVGNLRAWEEFRTIPHSGDGFDLSWIAGDALRIVLIFWQLQGRFPASSPPGASNRAFRISKRPVTG